MKSRSKEVQKFATNLKRRIVNKVTKNGLHENLGATEVAELKAYIGNDIYGPLEENRRIREILETFTNWTQTYNGKN